MRENTPVELKRCHQGGLDVHVGVDEPWHRDTAAALDLACAAILPVGADDRGAADCDVGWDQCTRDKIEEADVLDHQVGRTCAAALGDASSERATIDRH